MTIFLINLGNTNSHKVLCNKSSINLYISFTVLSVKDLGVSITYVILLQRAKGQLILATFLLVELVLLSVI